MRKLIEPVRPVSRLNATWPGFNATAGGGTDTAIGRRKVGCPVLPPCGVSTSLPKFQEPSLGSELVSTVTLTGLLSPGLSTSDSGVTTTLSPSPRTFQVW